MQRASKVALAGSGVMKDKLKHARQLKEEGY